MARSSARRGRAGRFGSALEFNGVDNWLTVADHSADRLQHRADDRSLGLSDVGRRLAHRRSSRKPRRGLSYGLYANGDTTGPGGHVAASAASTDSAHRHVAGAAQYLDASRDDLRRPAQLRLYVNGVLVGSRALTGGLQTSTSPLRIGGNGCGANTSPAASTKSGSTTGPCRAAENRDRHGHADHRTAPPWLAAAYGFNESAGDGRRGRLGTRS